MEVAIPPGVTHIGSGVFEHCGALGVLRFPLLGGDAAHGRGFVMSSTFSGFPGRVDLFPSPGARKVEGDFTGVVSVTMTPGILEITNCAFKGCVTLEEVSVSVQKVGDCAFEGCTRLITLALGREVHVVGRAAFKGCVGLTELVIPPNVNALGFGAFEGCSSLVRVSLESKVSIANRAFACCKSLTDLALRIMPTSVAPSTFESTINLKRVVLGAISAVDLRELRALEKVLAPGACVTSAALAGLRFGKVTIRRPVESRGGCSRPSVDEPP
jgi:hypothetical protein